MVLVDLAGKMISFAEDKIIEVIPPR